MARLDRLSDTELAEAAQRGNRAALEQLLHRHADRIFAICRRILAHPEDAKDATQEAMIAITRGIQHFDGRSLFTTWLYRVATNAALDEARRRNRRAIPTEHLPEIAQSSDVETMVTDRMVIDEALQQLTPEFRAAVALRDLCGLDYAEIASVLDIAPGTVRSRIARARAALAQHLSEPTGNQNGPYEHQST
jgi:RNA polymerase sigma-70 factor, ECF subfamily